MTLSFLIKSIILLAIALLNCNAMAQEDTSLLEPAGFVETDHISYFAAEEEKVNTRNQITVQLDLKGRLAKQVSFNASIEIREDFSDQSRNRFYLKEGVVQINEKNWQLLTGKLIENWGTVDGFNPTNVINPVDYSDLLDTDDERIGVVGANFSFYLKKLEFQALFIPTFTTHQLPQNDSRWVRTWPDSIPHPSEPNINFIAKYQILPAELPSSDLRNSQFGFKISHTLKGLDYSFSYWNGWSHSPSISQEATPISSDTILVSNLMEYYRHQMAGFDFETIWGKYGLRGEAAYFIPTGSFHDFDYVQFVIGIDRMFSNIIGYRNMHLFVQWIQEIAEESYNFPIYDLNHIIRRALASRICFELSPYSEIELLSLYNFDNHDFYIQPSISYNLYDGLNLYIASDLLGGDHAGFFGQYNNNNRIQLRLKYNF